MSVLQDPELSGAGAAGDDVGGPTSWVFFLPVFDDGTETFLRKGRRGVWDLFSSFFGPPNEIEKSTQPS